MREKIRWGILGCGAIAHPFTEGLAFINDAELTAVASRTKGKAADFAKKYNVPDYYNNYEDMVKNPNIDVIYVATTHNFHYENTLLCLKNNKHVLCEKPFTLNAVQASHLIKTARGNKLFLMEAMWTRFLPCITELNKMLSSKIIGEVKLLRADFASRIKGDYEGRLLDPKLAGGTLLDMGIYPISFSSMIFKKPPSTIKSLAAIGKTNIDEHVGCLFEYENGGMALLTSSIQVTMPHEAIIAGTKGYIRIPDFFRPTKLFIKLEDSEEELICHKFESTGYNYEASEVNNCIREARCESEKMPLFESLELMKVMDELRSQWGLKYPGEIIKDQL